MKTDVSLLLLHAFSPIRKNRGFEQRSFSTYGVVRKLKVSRDAEHRNFVSASSRFKKFLTPSATKTDMANWSLKVIRLPF